MRTILTNLHSQAPKSVYALPPSRSVVQVMMSFLNIEGVDVKALRAFRVLRPLRLVSGVPSESCPPV